MKFIEMVAEGVHDAWWDEKVKQGFHSPDECKSNNKESYINSSQQGKDRFLDAGLNPKLYRWCNKCISNIYSSPSYSNNSGLSKIFPINSHFLAS